MNLVEQPGGLTLVKDSRRIFGYVRQLKDGGYSYAFGSPNAAESIVFSGNKEPLSKEAAISRITDRM